MIVLPEPGEHALSAIAAQISELSRILHGSVVEEELRRATLIELDDLVETLFLRAAGVQQSAPSIHDIKVTPRAELEKLQ